MLAVRDPYKNIVWFNIYQDSTGGSGGAGAAASLPAGNHQLITDMGGNAQVIAFYDGRNGITLDGSLLVSAWDDTRGATGYGPQLAQSDPAKRFNYDLLSGELWKPDGGTQTILSALTPLFNLTNSVKALVIIGSVLPAAVVRIVGAIQDGAVANQLMIRADSTGATSDWLVRQRAAGANTDLVSGFDASTTRRVAIVTTSGLKAFSIQIPGRAKASSATASNLVSGDCQFYIGGGIGGGAGAAVLIRAVLILAFEPSVAQVAQLLAYGVTRHAAVDPTVSVASVVSVVASPATVAASPGATRAVVYRAYDAAAGAGNELPGRAITVASVDPNIVGVSPLSGVTPLTVTVSFLAEGTTDVAATAEGIVGVCTATVTPAPVASVVASPASFTQNTGATQAVIFRVFDGAAGAGNELSGRSISVVSSDPSKATVSPASGLTPLTVTVTAVAAGSSNINGTSETIVGTSVATIVAAPVAVASVVATPASFSVLPGGTQVVVFRAYDGAGGTGNELTGRTVSSVVSTDTAKATVSPASGVTPLSVTVTGVAAGTSNINATSETIVGTSAATVVGTTPVLSVTATPATLSVAPGGVQSIIYKAFSGAGGTGTQLTGRAITVSSSDPTKATVSPTSGTTPLTVFITGVALGTSNAIGTSEGQTGTCVVTVQAWAGPVAPTVWTPNLVEPATYVDLSDTGNPVTNMANLQAAYDAAVVATTVRAPAGTIFRGSFLMKAAAGRAAAAAFWVRPLDVTMFPPAGTRPVPSTATNIPAGMFVERVPIANWLFFECSVVNVPAVQGQNNGHDVVLRGCVVDRGTTTDQTYAVNTAGIGQTTNNPAVTPIDITLWQCYVREPKPFIGGTRFGFHMFGRRISLRDSWIEAIYRHGDESKAVGLFWGPGPAQVWNSFLESASINVLIGGSDPASASMNPQDFEFRRNWCFFSEELNQNNPASIRARSKRCTMSGITGTFVEGEGLTLSGGIPGAVLTEYQGTIFMITMPQGSGFPAAGSTITGVTSGKIATIQSLVNMSVSRKNCYEDKNLQRSVVRGNLLEGNINDGQAGPGIVFKSENNGGNAPFSVTQDVEFIYNHLHHSCAVMQWSGSATGAGQATVKTNGVRVSHLLTTDIGNPLLGPANARRGILMPPQAGFNWELLHSVWVAAYNIILFASSDGTGFVFKDCITDRGLLGIIGDGSQPASEGLSALDQYMPGHDTRGNLFARCNSGIYPALNSYPASLAAIGFTNLAGALDGTDPAGWFLAATSPHKGAGTDGADPGPDVAGVLAETIGCRNGIWPEVADHYVRVDSATTQGATKIGAKTWIAVRCVPGITACRGRIVTNSGSGGNYPLLYVDAVGSANSIIMLDNEVSGSGDVYLAFRITDDDNYLRWGVPEATGIPELYRVTAGVSVLLHTGTGTYTAKRRELAVKNVGTTLKLYVNGVLEGTVVQAQGQAATKHGWMATNTADATLHEIWRIGIKNL